jgi:hypothetical protein
MKEMFDLNTVLATVDSVGHWNGREGDAANAVNRIYTALYEAAPDDLDPDSLSEMMRRVWDRFSSDQTLPDLSDADVEAYVKSEFKG